MHRQKTVFYQKKFEKGNGELEYDNEEYGQEEAKNPQDEEEVEILDYLAVQPYELYSNVMNPMKRELDKFLKKDKENPNVFKNEMIKRQKRSKSLD